MNLGKYDNAYFIGIGGIGMSALARWFLSRGKKVFGYDRVETLLTEQLADEGAVIHFEDDPELIPPSVNEDRAKTVIIYTPAVPENHRELTFFRESSYTVMKRAEALGELSNDFYTVAVAGTHGKTTTSTMIASMLMHSGRNVTALLGGISTDYNTNYVEGKPDGKALLVVEADEFDRSFLQLSVDYGIVTSMDLDHLDVYGTEEAMIVAFQEFIKKVSGELLINFRIRESLPSSQGTEYYGGGSESQVSALDIEIVNGEQTFGYDDGKRTIEGIRLQQPGRHNVENAVAAIKVCLDLGLTPEEVKAAMASYSGVKRRFEFILKSDRIVFVDDYAHHPVEIDAVLSSLLELFPERKLTAVFQPHLYSRTKDLASEFGRSLSKANEVLLLDIYPAREEPMEGVTSELIFDEIQVEEKKMVSKATLTSEIDPAAVEVIVTIGAGDIDTLVAPLKERLLAA